MEEPWTGLHNDEGAGRRIAPARPVWSHQMLRLRPASRPRDRSIAEEVASWLPAVRPPQTTDRQWEVLSRLARGQPAHQIAQELGLSRQRIYQIVVVARRKLGDQAR